MHEADQAARAIAAMLDLVAAVVEDAVAEVDTWRVAALDDQDLVGADTEAPVAEVAVLGGGEGQGLASGVDHNHVIARTLHLAEAQLHVVIIGPAPQSAARGSIAARGVLYRLYPQRYCCGHCRISASIAWLMTPAHAVWKSADAPSSTGSASASADTRTT